MYFHGGSDVLRVRHSAAVAHCAGRCLLGDGSRSAAASSLQPPHLAGQSVTLRLRDLTVFAESLDFTDEIVDAFIGAGLLGVGANSGDRCDGHRDRFCALVFAACTTWTPHSVAFTSRSTTTMSTSLRGLPDSLALPDLLVAADCASELTDPATPDGRARGPLGRAHLGPDDGEFRAVVRGSVAQGATSPTTL